MNRADMLAVISKQRTSGLVDVRIDGVFDGVTRPLCEVHAKRMRDLQRVGAMRCGDDTELLIKQWTDTEADEVFASIIDTALCSFGAPGETDDGGVTLVEVTQATWVQVPAGSTFSRGGDA